MAASKERPKRRYKSIAEARRKLVASGHEKFFDENPTKYPCLECRGVGRIYDPNDPPDVIEGNKLRNRINCHKCKGTRCGTREEIVLVYREEVERHTIATEIHDRLMKAYRSGMAKLTLFERDALRQFGIPR